MAVRLNWPPEVVERLTEKARENGLSLDEYLLRAVLYPKVSDDATQIDEVEKRRRREQAAANIREIRKGVTLGPGLTIRDLINEGRPG